MDFKHKPVLLEECIEALNIKPDGIYVDGTLGGGGHSKRILESLSSKGMLIGIDRDVDALKAAKENLSLYSNVKYVHSNHDEIKEILENLKIEKVDGILLDLGVSSYQLDEKSRGFSYLGNNILDMRMDNTQELDAKTRIIAKNICEQRKNKEIETTEELVNIIVKSIPLSKQKEGHPAKRTFQAIRIEVNNEIKPLYNCIGNCIDVLKNNGRLAVITFHSLEDRAVKNAFIEAEGVCKCPKDLPYCVCGAESKGKIITKKPILPTENEQNENSRAKSAKLRVFEKKI